MIFCLACIRSVWRVLCVGGTNIRHAVLHVRVDSDVACLYLADSAYGVPVRLYASSCAYATTRLFNEPFEEARHIFLGECFEGLLGVNFDLSTVSG